MTTRTRLYDVFAANLGLYAPEHAGTFACPICLRVFPRDRICALSRAHFIPQALGGRQFTLACADCNSRVGHDIESYETTRATNVRAFSGAGTDNVPVSIALYDSSGTVGSVKADLRVVPGSTRPTVEVCFVPKASHPQEMEKVLHALREKGAQGSSDWGFRVHRNSRSGWKRARLTYLHAAFLYLFHEFGYEWALDVSTEAVRKQLLSPGEDIASPAILFSEELPCHPQRLTLHMVTSPRSARGFLVVMPALSHLPDPLSVWMPFFGGTYDMTDELVSNNRFSARPISPHHGYLARQESLMDGHRLATLFSG